MPRLLLALTLALALTTTACGGGSLNPDTLTPGPASRDLHIIAKNLKFDRNVLSAPANTDVSLTFANQETVPHNVAFYKDKSAKEKLFATDVTTGPEVKSYSFKMPDAGRYYFHCDVHPAMQGYLFVQ